MPEQGGPSVWASGHQHVSSLWSQQTAALLLTAAEIRDRESSREVCEPPEKLGWGKAKLDAVGGPSMVQEGGHTVAGGGH